MKISKRQLKRIIREEKARILEEAAHSFDHAGDHYVGGVRMTGPGADLAFGSKKRDDRSIADKVLRVDYYFVNYNFFTEYERYFSC